MIVAERPPGDAAIVRTAPETPGCASHARRWVLLATILGSSVAFMMASIINVALPAIQETYGATVAQMQWVASAYTVLLAALTLVGNSMGGLLSIALAARRPSNLGAAVLVNPAVPPPRRTGFGLDMITRNAILAYGLPTPADEKR